MPFADIAEMPFASIEAYLARLDVRMTEVKVMMSDVVSLPHMTKSDRKTTMNRWLKLLEIQSHEEIRPASKARLNMMGIGVNYVQPG